MYNCMQMTKMLDLLDAYLDGMGHQTCRIDGSVSWQDRQEAIRSFNNDPDVFIFLLSTRAGGLGINLTAADTVIIYDSDWNPHQDMQVCLSCHACSLRCKACVSSFMTVSETPPGNAGLSELSVSVIVMYFVSSNLPFCS